MESNNLNFEFALKQEGASIYFEFLSLNNMRDDNYKLMCDKIYSFCQRVYAQSTSEIIKKGDPMGLSIRQDKVPQVIQAIMTLFPHQAVTATVAGRNSHLEDETVIVNSVIDAITKVRSVVPYYNKNNNDLTTRRYK